VYVPAHFEVADQAEAIVFIDKNSFGQLVSMHNGSFYSTHLPLLLDKEGWRLSGHMARANPQWRDITGQEVLLVFQGPHAYVSPSWYESPGVPTWNYQAAHVYGVVELFDDAERLAQTVAALTEKYESAFTSPWQPEYRDAMLGAIIGLDISISRIECKSKLGQNRSYQDRRNVIAQLRADGFTAMADAMEQSLGRSGGGE